jgi:hypothetical protein
LQKVESIPIFDSFMDCEVDLDDKNDNDVEPISIVTTQNVKPYITPLRSFDYGETIVQLVSNALFSSWEPNNENLTLNPTLDFKGNIESRPLAPQATPQRNIPWSTQDSTFSSKTSSLLSSNSHLTHNTDEGASQVNRMFLRDEDDLTTHEKACVEAQPI